MTAQPVDVIALSAEFEAAEANDELMGPRHTYETTRALAKFAAEVLDAEVWQQHGDGERVVMWSGIEQAAIDAGIEVGS